MNNEIFQGAQTAYQNREYERALEAFTRCLEENPTALQPGEIGMLYHRIGNCLVKLGDYNEAIHAYTQATADAAYVQAGAVNFNLGNAYAALHDYEDAVRHFEIAASDAKYDAKYRAYTGMGNAYLKLGKSAEAGAAFRSAALDEGNPDPTKALLNLGICFMALNRPQDAVTSYENALQFDMSALTHNKICANLGQAYVASGQMQKAVSAFEEALADKTYFLSDSASVDYQRAIAQVSTGTSEIPPTENTTTDMSGLDVTADGSPLDEFSSQMTQQFDPYHYSEELYGDSQRNDYDEAYLSDNNRFFTASDEELERWSRGLARRERKRRNVGLKILVFIFVLLLLVFAGGVFAYTQGYGYPTQEQVVDQIFADPDQARSQFAGEISDKAVNQALAAVVTDDSITINGVERSMTNSEVYLTAQAPEGGDVQYQVSLVRSGISWKATNIQLYFASQQN